MSRSRVLNGGLGLALAWILSGCASAPSSREPAWPEQPTPAYPDPNEEVAAAPAKEEAAEPEVPAQDGIRPSSSSLAKEYQGKEAKQSLEGEASYYADSLAGNHTASGEVYDPALFTAAHRTLPFGTVLRVIRLDDGAVTYVRVNDRGPFGSKTRVVDLSRAAAEELGMMDAGVVEVRVEILEEPTG